MEKPIPVHQQFTVPQQEVVRKMWGKGYSQEKIAAKFGVSRRTIMKLCKFLGLKRSVKEAAELAGLKSELDRPEIIQKIRDMRNYHSLEEIVEVVGGSVAAVHRICDKYDIKLDKELFAFIQAERMRNAWTPERRDELSGSKYPQLNDPEWLQEHYIQKDISMGAIAKLIDVPLTSVSHHLKRHGIPIKTKEQYLKNLRRQSSEKRRITTTWGTFNVQSRAEAEFIEMLEMEKPSVVEYEPIVFESHGLQYVPDFRVDDEYIEIKPPEYARKPGIDRQKFIRQLLVAQANNIAIKCWYRKGGYFDIEALTHVDKYFCINWKLLFNSHNECFDFLVGRFMPLQWSRDRLSTGMNNLLRVVGPDLNANYPNQYALEFIKHFSPHFWHSTHKGYNTIADAFGEGNRNVLRRAVEELWAQKRNINIYGLVTMIAKKFKDFTTVSIFKPWVARYVYDKYLPNGGTIVDPCMGWGGRLLGTLDGNHKYIGFDLNPNVIESHNAMRKFIGARLTNEPSFAIADATTLVLPESDLLLTSPPYDDTELYHGIDSRNTITEPILENILANFNGIIALNLPKRQEDMCLKIATKCGRVLKDRLEMKTSSFMGREKTSEPILVFERK